jgi:hypothetical protein
MAWFKHRVTGEQIWLRRLLRDIELKLDGEETLIIARAGSYIACDTYCRFFRILHSNDLEEYDWVGETKVG